MSSVGDVTLEVANEYKTQCIFRSEPPEKYLGSFFKSTVFLGPITRYSDLIGQGTDRKSALFNSSPGSHQGNANQNHNEILSPSRMALIGKTGNRKCCQRRGDTGVLIHGCWECKTEQLPWQQSLRIPKMFDTDLPYDSAIPLLDVHPREMKMYIT